MIRELDAKIGKTMFHPLMILYCQKTGWTQYRLSRALMVLAIMSNVALCISSGLWFLGAINAVMMFVNIAAFVHVGDRPSADSFTIRVIFSFSFFVFLGLLILSGDRSFTYAAGYFFLAVASDYAKTIKHIPPAEVEKKYKLARAK